MRIFSFAEYCRLVLGRISFNKRSAGALPVPDFCLIFAPYGYDEPEILPSESPLICHMSADSEQPCFMSKDTPFSAMMPSNTTLTSRTERTGPLDNAIPVLLRMTNGIRPKVPLQSIPAVGVITLQGFGHRGMRSNALRIAGLRHEGHRDSSAIATFATAASPRTALRSSRYLRWPIYSSPAGHLRPRDEDARRKPPAEHQTTAKLATERSDLLQLSSAVEKATLLKASLWKRRSYLECALKF